LLRAILSSQSEWGVLADQVSCMNQEIERVSIQSACAVRLAQPGDLAGQLGYPSTGEEVRKRLNQMQDANQYAVFVAELPTGQIAGWIGLYIFRTVELETIAEISGVIVDEDIRSCGIGKMLLDAADEWARRVECHVISVRSNVKRDRAHQFYTNNGYEHVKTQKELRKKL
jgi:GNAT superfamily N-acetyltransferase